MATTRAEARRDDPYDLERFVRAQAGVYDQALRELEQGHKRSHWMWFIFPQLAGLGSSSMAERYAIRSVAEAEQYLAHPVLGPRLVACAEAMLAAEGRSASAILGHPDDLKLRSSMTLFSSVGGAPAVFGRVLDKYYAGEPDQATLELLRNLA